MKKNLGHGEGGLGQHLALPLHLLHKHHLPQGLLLERQLYHHHLHHQLQDDEQDHCIARPKKNPPSVYIRYDQHHDRQEYLFLQLMQLLTGCVHRVLELQNVLVSFFPLSDISLSFQQKHTQTKFPP